LARLDGASTEPPPVASPPGIVEISSRPLANLYIDGNATGTTPYRGKLAAGRHKLRMTARGYHTWEGSIEVGDAGTLPLAVTLRGKGKGAPDVVPATGGSTGGTPATPTATVPSVTTPSEPARQPDKKDPFLPTKPTAKPGSGDDPFLPVKKP
ncbi:MAG: PEGA domain-containing protein, partial [Deltaproteobacteria bacterium]|nr:PEGA domain-containing protein [Nannocystaceae bacterium]